MDALSRLSELAAQERTKTATLRASVRAYCAELTKVVGVEDNTEISIQAGGFKLSRKMLVDSGHNGTRGWFWCFWIIGKGYYAVDAEVGQQLFLSTPSVGYTGQAEAIPVIGHDELRLFSTMAQEFVNTLHERYAHQLQATDIAIMKFGGAR